MYNFYNKTKAARNSFDSARHQKTAENKTVTSSDCAVKFMSNIFDKPSKIIKRLACK
jgi:hypothetical protein